MKQTVPDTKQKTSQFQQRLRLLIKGAKGWHVNFMSPGHGQSYTRFVCPHGKVQKQQFYPIEPWISPVMIADGTFREANEWCDGGHIMGWTPIKMQGIEKSINLTEMMETKPWPQSWSFDDCPVCHAPVISGVALNGMLHPIYYAQPCNHEVDIVMLATWYNEGTKVHVKLSLPLPTPNLSFSLASGASVGSFVGWSESTASGTSVSSQITKACPGLVNVFRDCPACTGDYATAYTNQPLINLIPHINDHHQWSREKIADWLDIIALDNPEIDLTIKTAKKEVEDAQPSIGPGEQAKEAEYAYY